MKVDLHNTSASTWVVIAEVNEPAIMRLKACPSPIGISLGDECIVEAGLYVTGGSLITLPDGEVVKGRTLSGASGLLFRRNSVTGAIEATQRSGNWGGLNAALHKN